MAFRWRADSGPKLRANWLDMTGDFGTYPKRNAHAGLTSGAGELPMALVFPYVFTIKRTFGLFVLLNRFAHKALTFNILASRL